MNKEEIIKFIKEHGLDAWSYDNTIKTWDIWTDAYGIEHRKIITLPIEIEAIKFFLGY